MLLRFNPHKLFFAAILYSVFLGYIFNSGIVAYGPLILMAAFVFLFEMNPPKKLEKKSLFIALLFLPYVVWAGFVYISNPYEGRYFTTHFLTILILPILVLTFSRMFLGENNERNYDYVYKSLFIFLILQLFICVGQISTYTLGVGFPVSEMHAANSMLSGTFTNSNDLAAITLIALFFVVGLEKRYFLEDKYYFWIIDYRTFTKYSFELLVDSKAWGRGSRREYLCFILVFFCSENGVCYICLEENTKNETLCFFNSLRFLS